MHVLANLVWTCGALLHNWSAVAADHAVQKVSLVQPAIPVRSGSKVHPAPMDHPGLLVHVVHLGVVGCLEILVNVADPEILVLTAKTELPERLVQWDHQVQLVKTG